MSTSPKKLQLHKLYFLHGFSGDPNDWDGVIEHLPDYHCEPLIYPFKLPKNGILIGYSMGGRIALHSPCPKIIISAHPGLKTPEEKAERAARELYWIQKLTSVPLPQFFDEWYAQPLFTSLRAHPHFPQILERRLKQDPQTLLHQLECYRLSNQSAPHENAIFIYGQLDEAYSDLYRKLKIPAHEIPRAGHACHLENPVDTARQIKILINSFR